MKRLQRRTVIFLVFMGLFFALAGYLTYYSGVVYLNQLPEVDMQLPERTGQYANGRMTYYVPQTAIHQDPDTGKNYILAARYTRDVLGERYLAVRINVWILDKTGEQMAEVDGIVWEEPVLLDTGDTIQDGDALKFPTR